MSRANWDVFTHTVELIYVRVSSRLGHQELPFLGLYTVHHDIYGNLNNWLNASFEWCSYLLVVLSSKSQRSSATRNTHFNLMGSEMVWTWAFSTSNISNWLLQQRIQSFWWCFNSLGCTGRWDQYNLPVFLIEKKPVLVSKFMTHFMSSL